MPHKKGILARYVLAQCSGYCLGVVGFLSVVLLGGRLIRYFGMAANGGLNLGYLLPLVGYHLPAFLELILPLSLFVAVLLLITKMQTNHEMAACLASGISKARILIMLWPLCIGIFGIQAALTLSLKPHGVRHATALLAQGAQEAISLMTPKIMQEVGKYSLWVEDIDAQQKTLFGVVVVEQALPQVTILSATRATYNTKQEGILTLTLTDGSHFTGQLDSQARRLGTFERISIDLPLPSPAVPDPKIEGIKTTDLPANATGRAELGYRLGLPFLVWFAPLCAYLWSPLAPRKSGYVRLLPACVCFAVCVLLMVVLKEQIAKGALGVWAYGAYLGALFGGGLVLAGAQKQ